MVAAFTELHNNVQKTDVGFPALQFAFTWCGSTGNIGEKKTGIKYLNIPTYIIQLGLNNI